jgi:NTE family protein
VLVWLSLSGGGTRAAALAYGVMEALEKIAVRGEDGKPSNLLREVDYISSVSGGSFAAAFYALNRDGDWKGEFKKRVLDENLETAIGSRLIEPPNFLSVVATNYSRTDVASGYYDSRIFDGKRFRHLPQRPVLILNASDLVTGRRFEFTQRDFNCLGSDLLDYRIADAVTASSAFPGAFPSLILENHGPHNECPSAPAPRRSAGACLTAQERQAAPFVTLQRGSERDSLRNGIYLEAERKRLYCDVKGTRHVHLSDGGLTDNLGVDALLSRAYDPSSEIHAALTGDRGQRNKLKAVVIIAVNAATAQREDLGEKPEGAWFGRIILRGIDLMMDRVAWESLDAVRDRVVEFERYGREERDPEFRFYFLEVTFADIADAKRREEMNSIGTRLSLPQNQVSAVIEAGGELLVSGRNGDNGRNLDRIRALFNSLSP